MLNRGGQQGYKSSLVFILFLFIYCAFIISFSRYTFNLDDIWMWLDIYQKKPIYNGFNPANGRLFPLASMDLNLLMQISNSPYLFFSFNALIVFSFCLIYLKILNLVNDNKRLNNLIVALFTLSLGFVVVMFGICYPERMLILFLSIFILCSFYMLNNPSKTSFIIGILTLNLSLYLKEPIFISMFILGILLICSNLREKIKFYYSLCIIISSSVYPIMYIVFIFGNITAKYTRYTENTNIALESLRGILNYALNDGIIIFLLNSVFIYRIYKIFIKKEKFLAFFDGLLAASFTYLCVFIALMIFESYYLLPCYILGGVPMVYFLITEKYIKVLFIKICFILGISSFITSSIPSGIYNAINLKAIGIQFNDILKFSASYLAKQPNTTIYFDGIGRGRELYAEYYVGYFIEYLNKIYKIYDFDIRSYEKNGKDILAINKESPYSYKNSIEISSPKSKDLIILSNVTIHNTQYIKNLINSHTLLYKTNFSTIPYISLKSIIKYINTLTLKSNNEIFGHNNIFRLPINTYIFITN
ncbi:hypothetical protein [Helicobacter sp. MIT 14-3879]|uniref:hypothetical protein n=1 Tax=Helicobacter sp. MIT 14-3879 TaxID=2040649 RepID=UPI000E1F135D|nr:hypothetical protein [Helicobacter sp. MIT 14-3879]RDU64650.1 hypothetical protein CQA44_02755 [Helicobacter sp. MIT 14-3879]